MLIRPTLLIWLFRSNWSSHVALPVACLWVLFTKEPLSLFQQIGLPTTFILLHSLAITAQLGKFRTAPFAYFYSRGFSRDKLWGHQMLASLLAVGWVWLPAALLVWTPARSAVQDLLYRSPYYPLMSPREVWVPLWWLAGYAILLPVFHYAWIRQAQPVRWPTSGNWLALALVVAFVTLFNVPNSAIRASAWYVHGLLGGGVLIAAVLLIAGRRLHRQLEVSS